MALNDYICAVLRALRVRLDCLARSHACHVPRVGALRRVHWTLLKRVDWLILAMLPSWLVRLDRLWLRGCVTHMALLRRPSGSFLELGLLSLAMVEAVPFCVILSSVVWVFFVFNFALPIFGGGCALIVILGGRGVSLVGWIGLAHLHSIVRIYFSNL